MVSDYTYKNNNINCKSNNWKIAIDGTEVYQTTSMFRGMNSEDIDFIWHGFEKEPKVNVINLACSDGSEPMSWAIGLMEKYGLQINFSLFRLLMLILILFVKLKTGRVY